MIADVQASGARSLRQIAAGLNQQGIPSARGGAWTAIQVKRVLHGPFELKPLSSE